MTSSDVRAELHLSEAVLAMWHNNALWGDDATVTRIAGEFGKLAKVAANPSPPAMDREAGWMRVAAQELLTYADLMPKETPAPGHCSTEHDFKIQAGAIWGLAERADRLRIALAGTGDGVPEEETTTSDAGSNRSDIEECTDCGWQCKPADLKGGTCPECGAVTMPLSEMYPDDPTPTSPDESRSAEGEGI